MRTSASSAASSGSPTDCRRTSARTGSSTPRSPSPASSAPRSAWPCAATGPSWRSSSTASSSRVRPDRHAARQDARPRARQDQAAGRHPDPVRRWHRRRRAPLGVPQALFAHVAGLKVVSPSTSSDAYWMLQQAIQSDDPVIFFEPKRRYWDERGRHRGHPGRAAQGTRRPRGHGPHARRVRPMVKVCLEAAAAAQEEGKSVEVLDLRSMSPIDFDAIQTSVEKTRHLVVVHEAPVFYGSGAEIAAGSPSAASTTWRPRPAGRRLPRAVSAGAPGGGVPAGSGPRARRRRPLAGVLTGWRRAS